MGVVDIRVGDRVRSTWTIRRDGGLVDPPAILFVVQRPDRQEFVSGFGQSGTPTYPIVKSSSGVYYADIPLIDVAPADNNSLSWVRTWLAYDENGAPLGTFQRAFEVKDSLLAVPLPAVPA